MSLVRNLMQSGQDMVDVSDIEKSFGEVHEGFFDDTFAQMLTAIYEVDEAYLTADIIGTCRVVTEGGDPTAIMESMISSGINKLIEIWKKALAKVKAFFAKVIQFVKSMVLTGKKFVDEFGPKIKERVRSTKNFSVPYKGYKYNIKSGESLVNGYKDHVNKVLTDELKGLDSAGTLTAAQIMAKIGVKSEKDRVSATDLLEKTISEMCSGCTTVTEIQDKIRETYRNGDTATDNHTAVAGDIDGMLDYVASAKGTIEKLNKDKKNQECLCNNLIRKLQSIQKPKDDENKDKYETASTLSQGMTVLLNLYKSIINCDINMVKEISKSYTGILRKALNASDKKITAESTLFEGDDDIDMDMDDDIEIDESAIAGADEPEGDDSDIGVVREGCGKKCATTEGCKKPTEEACGKKSAATEGGCGTDVDPLEEAMMYL